MKSKEKFTGFLLIFLLALAFFTHSLASAEWDTQKTPRPVRETDLSVSPFKGPIDAPVEISVFSDFQ